MVVSSWLIIWSRVGQDLLVHLRHPGLPGVG
jgi:hypothetical protein